MPQSYGNVPAFVKGSEPLCPCVSTAVVPTPLTRALCAAASLLVQVTVSPAVIVTLCGSNLYPTMSTGRTAADALVAIAMNRSAPAAIAKRAAFIADEGVRCRARGDRRGVPRCRRRRQRG